MEMLPLLVGFYMGIHQFLVDYPHKRTVMWNFVVSSAINLNKLWYKQLICQLFDTPGQSCDIIIMSQWEFMVDGMVTCMQFQ